jgi:hypothetical protein
MACTPHSAVHHAPHTISLATAVQMVDDRNPHIFLFGAINAVSVTCRNCTLLSPCGGRGPEHLHKRLQAAYPFSPAVRPNKTRVANGLSYDAFMRIPITGAPAGAVILLLNTDIICYDPATRPFAPTTAPKLWQTGSAATAVRAQDTCQHPETLGADYRGTVNQTKNGQRCQAWNAHTPQVWCPLAATLRPWHL